MLSEDFCESIITAETDRMTAALVVWIIMKGAKLATEFLNCFALLAE